MLQVPVCLGKPLAGPQGQRLWRPLLAETRLLSAAEAHSPGLYWAAQRVPTGLAGWGHLGPGHPEETEGGCPQGRLRWQEQ